MFDANQLYQNALGSPQGARRTVAIDLLRPIAAATNAIGLSGLVNSANTALHRNPPAISARFHPLAALGPRPPNNESASGVAPRPHTRAGQSAATNTGARVWPPPLRPPTASHPLVVLDIGDSVGEDLGFGLGDLFSGDRYIHLVQKSRESTGLAQPQYYNWPGELETFIHQYHPGAVVVMMGANDMRGLDVNGRFAALGSAAWWHGYSQRVALLMAEATASGAHVLWVGLPPMNGGAVTSPFAEQVNGLAKVQAAVHSGVTYVPSWHVLGGKKGVFTQYLNVNGNQVQVRYGDGVHLTPSGWDILARAILQPMQRAFGVPLHAH